jgi:hypothetical protein
VTAANELPYQTELMDTLSRRVVVGDGAMGTQLQATDLSLDDFNDREGCDEILNETRLGVIEQIHRNYFEAGADKDAGKIRELPLKGTAVAKRPGVGPRRRVERHRRRSGGDGRLAWSRGVATVTWGAGSPLGIRHARQS